MTYVKWVKAYSAPTGSGMPLHNPSSSDNRGNSEIPHDVPRALIPRPHCSIPAHDPLPTAPRGELLSVPIGALRKSACAAQVHAGPRDAISCAAVRRRGINFMALACIVTDS